MRDKGGLRSDLRVTVKVTEGVEPGAWVVAICEGLLMR